MNKDLEIHKLETMNQMQKDAIRDLEFTNRKLQNENEWLSKRYVKAMTKQNDMPDTLLHDVCDNPNWQQIAQIGLNQIPIVNLTEGPLGNIKDFCEENHIWGL